MSVLEKYSKEDDYTVSRLQSCRVFSGKSLWRWHLRTPWKGQGSELYLHLREECVRQGRADTKVLRPECAWRVRGMPGWLEWREWGGEEEERTSEMTGQIGHGLAGHPGWQLASLWVKSWAEARPIPLAAMLIVPREQGGIEGPVRRLWH